MLILGILLIAAALVVFGYMFFGTSDLPPMDIDLGIFTVQLTPLHLYLLGAATLAVLTLGLLLLAAGMRASRRRRHEVKELRKAVHDGSGDTSGRPDSGARPTTSSDRPPSGGGTDYEREVPLRSSDESGRARDAATAAGAQTTSSPNNGPGTGSSDAKIALPSDYPNDTPQDGAHRP